MMKRVCSLLSLAALAACAAPPPETVSIDFSLEAAGQPVVCGQSVSGLNKPATLTDARLYLHDVALIDATGRAVPVSLTPSIWQRDGIVLLDFEDATGTCRGTPATNTTVLGNVPAAQYVGLAFTIGVPSPQNHTSPTVEAAPLDLVAMGWTWQAGRKFIKIELDPEGGVARKAGKPMATWNLHLGSTGCSGDPVKGEMVICTTPNRVAVRFPVFSAARDRVVLDLATLFDETDLGHDGGGALGCMSGADDPDCPGVFRQLGLPPTANPAPAVRVAPKG